MLDNSASQGASADAAQNTAAGGSAQGTAPNAASLRLRRAPQVRALQLRAPQVRAPQLTLLLSAVRRQRLPQALESVFLESKL